LKSGFKPCIPTAVEHRGTRVTDPAQHPPQACSKKAAGSVVTGHLLIVAHAERGEPRTEFRRIRQRVASIGSGFGPGQILIQVQETRAVDVRLRIGTAAHFSVDEIVAAVEHDPCRIVDVRREVGDGDQSREAHSEAQRKGR